MVLYRSETALWQGSADDDLLEIRFGMFADGADEIIGKFFPYPLIAADHTAPDGLSFIGFSHRLRFGFDIGLIIRIGAGRPIGQYGHKGRFAEKQHMAPEIHFLLYLQ